MRWQLNSSPVRKGGKAAFRNTKRFISAKSLAIEPLEQRALLTAGLFLQGTAFVDNNANGVLDYAVDHADTYKVGTTIQLRSGDGSQLLATTTTDSHGAYLFDDSNVSGGLTPGSYRLVEIPPAGFVNEGVQIVSSLYQAQASGPNSIQVTLPSVSNLTVKFASRGPYLDIDITSPRWTDAIYAEQFNIQANLPTGQVQFRSFCLDPGPDIVPGDSWAPLPRPSSTASQIDAVLPQNAGQIAYLYNHHGLTPLSNLGAAGLQIAIWELEYDNTPNLTSGNFILGSSTPNYASVKQSADAFLAESAGKYETAIVLDGALIPHPAGQSILAAESYNFANTQPAIQIVKLTNNTNNDSPPVAGVPDGPMVPVGSPVTWTYIVTNPGNEPIENVEVTDDHVGIIAGQPIGDTNSNNKLDPNETWGYAAAGTAVAGQYSNIGGVTGASTLSHTSVGAQNPDHYFGVQPGIQIVKKTNDLDNANAHVAADSTVTWTYFVTNTGNVALKDVAVTDNMLTVPPAAVLGSDNLHNIGDANNDSLLQVGETWEFTASGTAIAGQYVNTGTATGTDATNTVTTPVTASEDDGYFGDVTGIRSSSMSTTTTPTARPAHTWRCRATLLSRTW
jgi:hypothetical protein